MSTSDIMPTGITTKNHWLHVGGGSMMPLAHRSMHVVYAREGRMHACVPLGPSRSCLHSCSEAALSEQVHRIVVPVDPVLFVAAPESRRHVGRHRSLARRSMRKDAEKESQIPVLETKLRDCAESDYNTWIDTL